MPSERWMKDEINGGRGRREEAKWREISNPSMCSITPSCAVRRKSFRWATYERVGNRTFSQKGLTTVLYPVENHCQPTRVCKVSHYTNTYIRALVKSLPKVAVIVALIKFLDARKNELRKRSIYENKSLDASMHRSCSEQSTSRLVNMYLRIYKRVGHVSSD